MLKFYETWINQIKILERGSRRFTKCTSVMVRSVSSIYSFISPNTGAVDFLYNEERERERERERENYFTIETIHGILSYFISDSPGGLVFGIPLSQCLENDRIARIAAGEVSDVGCLSRNSRHGSRTSFTSLIEPTVAAKTDEVSEVVEHSLSSSRHVNERIRRSEGFI